MTGKFIVVEGLDGSGKSFQAEKLNEYLLINNSPTFRTQEPTNSDIGNLIRAEQKEDPDNTALFHLYAADRKYHCDIIRNLLNQGFNVLCDRYWYSSYAYQGVNNDKLKNKVFNLYSTEPWVVKPDLIIFINTKVDTCLQRIGNRGNDTDFFEKGEYLKEVYKNYIELWDKLSSTIRIIDGNQEKEKVTSDIIKVIEDYNNAR